MGRTKTLRGVLECKDGNRSVDVNVLDYVSPQRNRGWRVRKVWLWCSQLRASTPNDDNGRMVITAHVSTEIVKATFDSVVADNRVFGWMTREYHRRTTTSGSSTNFVFPTGDGIWSPNRFIIDSDTMLVKECWIAMSCTSDGTDEPNRIYNYMFELEEVKITPEESIIQQLKGIGQSV